MADDLGLDYYTPEEPHVKRVVFDVYNNTACDFQKLQREFMMLTKQERNCSTYEGLIAEEFEEWEFENQLTSAEVSNAFGQEYSPEAELKELVDLLYVIMGYANCRGWDMGEAYRRVDQNNKNRCIQPDGSVKFNEQGKVLKNKDYPKVDLSDLV